MILGGEASLPELAAWIREAEPLHSMGVRLIGGKFRPTMNTPIHPGITTCVQVTPPGTRQSMATFLNEELPAAVKRKPSFEISPVLLEHAFVDPAAYPGESVQEYAKRQDEAKVNAHILKGSLFLHRLSGVGGGVDDCPF